jgi:hypothetical protein
VIAASDYVRVLVLKFSDRADVVHTFFSRWGLLVGRPRQGRRRSRTRNPPTDATGR